MSIGRWSGSRPHSEWQGYRQLPLPRHRGKEFIKFLNQLEKEAPDNYSTHKSAGVQLWLKPENASRLAPIPTCRTHADRGRLAVLAAVEEICTSSPWLFRAIHQTL
jgi:hypothetical protein